MNRQVPRKNYLIIGRGRLARHLGRYFNLLNITHRIWYRESAPELLQSWAQEADKILMAIPDGEIEAFIVASNLPQSKTVHFSGALNTKLAEKIHPLMTFSNELYELDDYLKIPFVGVKGKSTLKQLLPELDNPYYEIEENQFALYHALCVLSGNGTVVLWQNVIEAFAKNFDLPREILTPYLERIFINLSSHPDEALTGPWSRGDVKTIEKNKAALETSALFNVYQALSESLPLRSNL